MNFFAISLYVLLVVAGSRCDTDRRALVIVDVQNCFVPGGTLPVPNGNEIVPVINSIRKKYENRFHLVIVTQDWHCSNHISFASQHTNHKPFDTITLEYDNNKGLCKNTNNPQAVPYAVDCQTVMYKLNQTLWPDHCKMNTTDAEILSSLIQQPTDVIIQKGYRCHIDSYSAFWDNGHLTKTHLQKILSENKIETLFLVGLAIDYCVYFTAMDAISLGYKTYLIEDATRGISSATIASAKERMISSGVHIINSSNLEKSFANYFGMESLVLSITLGFIVVVFVISMAQLFNTKSN